MTRADRKNADLRKTRLKFQQPLAAAGRPSARNYEALSKTRYNTVRISNFGLKCLQYILNILYSRIKQKKKISIFATQVTRLIYAMYAILSRTRLLKTAWTTCVQSQTILFFDIYIFCFLYKFFML